jgi:hypothetical protein
LRQKYIERDTDATVVMITEKAADAILRGQ